MSDAPTANGLSLEYPAGTPLLRHELSGFALVVARGAAIAFTLVLLLMYLRWVPRWLDLREAEAAAAAALGGPPLLYAAAWRTATTMALLSAAAWFALAVLMFAKRSRDLLGIFMALTFVSIGVLMTDLPVIIYMAREDPWAPVPAIALLIANSFTVPWAYVFPDGRFVPRWMVYPAAAWVLWSILRMVTPEADQARIGLPAIVLNSAFQASTIGAFTYRCFTSPDPVLRQQIKWLVPGGLLFIGALIVTVPPRYLVPELAEGGPAFLLRSATALLVALATISLALLMAISIFRQGLLNINLLINRTITYLALTFILAALLTVLALGATRLLHTTIGQRSELALLAAVVPTALMFMPMRAWLLSIADRFVSDRTVRTLAFLDIVDSTKRAVALGDHEWWQLLERFRRVVRARLARHGGQEVDTAGDGFFVTFEGPGRAIRWALDVIEHVRPLQIDVRAGAHVGEVEAHGNHVTGVAVHVAARVMSASSPGELTVSQAVRNLVAGSSIRFADRGTHMLKGVPGSWRLFSVVPSAARD